MWPRARYLVVVNIPGARTVALYYNVCRCTHRGVLPISEYVAEISRPHNTLPGKSRVWCHSDGANSVTKKRQVQYTRWVWDLSSQVGVSYCLFRGSHGHVDPLRVLKKAVAWYVEMTNIYSTRRSFVLLRSKFTIKLFSWVGLPV